MSVFVINSDNEADNETSPTQQKSQTLSEAGAALFHFWPRVTEEIRQIQNLDVRCQVLPLARIKKIMKLDDEVKMISGEAPVLFAKAAEMFIQELTLRAWIHTEDNKRRTLQRNDIAMAIAKYDQFDFLIDIVPREEVKPQPPTATNRSAPLDHVQYYLQINQQQQQQQQAQAQPAPSQVITQPIQTVEEPKPMQLLQQVLSPTGDIQHVPVQLTPSQMQMLRMQLQANTNQPLIIQPQIIQPMVVKQSKMNDEDDLEALRLAALQTIRPRYPKVSAPFIRPPHNPNLIAIVPTASVPPTINRCSSRDKTASTLNSPKPSMKNGSPCREVGTGTPTKTDPKPLKKEKKLERIKLDLDDDVLDFEGDNDESEEKSEEDEDAVVLHADDDSLEKLMDEMEEELSEEPLKKNGNTSTVGNDSVKLSHNQERLAPNASAKSTPPNSAATHTNSVNATRSKSPVLPRRRSRSPYAKKWSRSRSRSRSPRMRLRSRSRTRSKSPRRRSPLRGRSRSPALRRVLSRSRSRSKPRLRSRTRSPIFRRSRSPPKYARRSPPIRNSRRSRSRSWPSPRREYRSPSRRPVNSRKRTPSPSRRSLSCERKFRRSVSPRKRSLSPMPERCRRKRSPLKSHRRHHGAGGKRSSPLETSSPKMKDSPSDDRKSLPEATKKPPSDSIPSLLDISLDLKSTKMSLSPKKITSSELTSSNSSVKLAGVDPKLEARRKKFESTAPVAALSKKIRLKASSPVGEQTVAVADDVSTFGGGVEEQEEDDKVQAAFELSRKLHRKSPASLAVESSAVEHRRLLVLRAKNKRGVAEGIIDVESGEIDEPKPSGIRFTVADAEKEIREMKLKRHHNVEFDVDGVKETPDASAVEKHKRKKKRKKEKRAKKEAALLEPVAIAETEEVAPSSAGGSDLRAEISRRRAERLKGQVKEGAILRIVQSAFQGVVGKRKHTKSSKDVLNSEEQWPKSVGGRRVQLLQASQKIHSKSEKSRNVEEEDESEVEETDKAILPKRPGGSCISSTAISNSEFLGMLK